jgi:hypothetical protein
MACALFFSPPKLGASALMMKAITSTPMIAPTNVQTAMASPAVSGRR